jgi:hypothetical protein
LRSTYHPWPLPRKDVTRTEQKALRDAAREVFGISPPFDCDALFTSAQPERVVLTQEKRLPPFRSNRSER